MGGTANIWEKAGRNFGLEIYEDDPNKINEIRKEKSRIEKELFEKSFSASKQMLNDRKLEFFSYSAGWKIGCEKCCTGHADKVYHGPGPLCIKFKDTPEKNKLDKVNRIYMNLDGEYYHIVKPIEIRIRLAKNFGGRLKFLQNIGHQ
jgi:hypothetical protein